jgi:cytochrome c1
MTKRSLMAAAAAMVVALGTSAGASEAPPVPRQQWSFSGLFGTFDRGEVQRGLQVYREVCLSCHGMQFIAFRNLEGIGLSADQIATLAAQHEVEDGPNEAGDMFTRPARPSDRFPSPFANENAARAANNGAYPPDLSLITKARVGGVDYLKALLIGYQDPPPEGVTLMDGMYYNDYFPGHQIAMPPPLTEDRVTYEDGTAATVDQMARDVTAFLAWAAQPELEERRRLGIKVLLFVIVFTGLAYALKRQVWSDVH